jgi:lipopolysaccharide transport system ATP-binding protein
MGQPGINERHSTLDSAMSNLAIQATGLSKQYRIGKKEPYRTLRGSLNNAVAAPFKGLRSKWRPSTNGHNSPGKFWALEDISFDIKHGEVVGVIGRNGAGKSTLLKILSRITEPTKGYADVRGRVGSLLEVGTGFHPELTGRENIYLNGAIIGMKNAEINRKIDEIVAFSEVEKFIDTPIKHFSSGMYLRLAFSVAAHLEPEILLIDEVLAVGDMAFQRKCLGKMEETAANGRTIIFVSHNLGAVKELCTSGIVLSGGHLDYRGPVVEALAHYSRSLGAEGDGVGLRRAGWRRLLINGAANGMASTVRAGDPLLAEVSLDLSENFGGGHIICIIGNSTGDVVVHQRIAARELSESVLEAGQYRLKVELPPLWLAPGVYTLYFKFIGRILSGRDERLISDSVILDVTGESHGIGRALLAPSARWTMTSEKAL